jgi:excinuclease ABC subunit C
VGSTDQPTPAEHALAEPAATGFTPADLTPSGSLPPGIDPETGRPRRFAYPPQLLVVDGGAPQVNAAAAVLTELDIADVTVCGLAKRLEEVWLPGEDDPVIFPRTSEALYLLQRLRDEAHRFAITYHRQKRSKSMTVSALDTIPGLGTTRRKALLRHFGSVAKVRRATAEEITAVPGIGRATAEAIVAALAAPAEPDQPAAEPFTPRGASGSQVAEDDPVPSPTATPAGTQA